MLDSYVFSHVVVGGWYRYECAGLDGVQGCVNSLYVV